MVPGTRRARFIDGRRFETVLRYAGPGRVTGSIGALQIKERTGCLSAVIGRYSSGFLIFLEYFIAVLCA